MIDFSKMVDHYRPEVSYFYSRNNETVPELAFSDVWAILTNGTINNMKAVGDVFLGLDDPSNPFNSDTFRKYLKMLVINEGLGGLFIRKTPREYIEGYNDTLVAGLASTPMEAGGSPTSSPFMSINGPDGRYGPVNEISFFVGDDEYELTRQYGKWLNSTSIAMPAFETKGLRTFTPFLRNPWGDMVAMNGSDGAMGQPLMDEN